MRQYKFLAIFLLQFLYSQAQDDFNNKEVRAALKKSAQTMVQLFSKENFEEYVKYVHPKIIQMLGGKEKMIEGLKISLNQMKNEGFTFKSISVGNPSKIISTQGELQSVLPQTIEMNNADGVLKTISYLIAISKDDGKSWHYIDTSDKNLEQIKRVFTTLSDDLIIPPRSQPTFTNN